MTWRRFLAGLGIIGIAYAALPESANYSQSKGTYEETEDKSIEGDFTLTGGEYKTTKSLDVKGKFFWGKDAEFDHGAAPLILRGEIEVEEKSKLVIDPAQYATEAIYNLETGMLIHATGALLSATGSHIETYSPSLGHVIIAP